MNAMRQRISIIVLLACTFFVCSAISAQASVWGTDATSELNGSRTNSLGVTGIGEWATGFSISWSVEESDGLWTYSYTITTDRRDISHFILELTESDMPFAHLDGSDDFTDPQWWDSTSGNPNMPNPLYGTKFDFSGPSSEDGATYTIVTDRDPVWGIFYAKDGIQTEAWSSALDFADYRTNENLTTNDFIVRPNGGLQTPIPGAVWLLGSGLIGLVGLRKKIKK